MRKRVIITRSNPVRPDSRVEKEALSLFENGYDVKILCWDRDSNHKAIEETIDLNGIKIPIVRLGFKATFGEGFKNIKSYLKFQFSMRKWLKKHHSDFDILHACDFDTAFFTYKIAMKMKKKFIFDIFDFLHGEPKNFLQKCVKKAQFKIINSADLTIICTEERKNQIKGSKPNKLIVVHNSPSFKQLPSSVNIEKRNNDKIRVCYVGILQDGRLLKEIGHFFSLHPEYELYVGGFGYLEEYFKKLSEIHDNIYFFGRVPYNRTLELEMNCDLMLAIYDPKVENHRYAAPNKFYESLFLGKPVIMVKGTGMSTIVEKNNAGVLMDYSEIGFEIALKAIVEKRNYWHKMSENLKSFYENNYKWEIMEKRLLDAYKEL